MKLVRQRSEADCGVASLAMISEQTYEDAYIAVTQVQPTFRGKKGLDNKEVIAAAKKLGLDLFTRKRYDLDDEEGILRIRWNSKPGRSEDVVKYESHFVVVIHGLIVCPSYLEIMPWRDYLQRAAARACTLLAKDKQSDEV